MTLKSEKLSFMIVMIFGFVTVEAVESTSLFLFFNAVSSIVGASSSVEDLMLFSKVDGL